MQPVLPVAPLTVQSATSHGVTFHSPIMVSEELMHAARHGGRTGAVATGTTAGVTAAVESALADAKVKGATVRVLVNGTATEVADARPGDEITVAVSVPYGNVTWVRGPRYLAGKTLTRQVVIRRE